MPFPNHPPRLLPTFLIPAVLSGCGHPAAGPPPIPARMAVPVAAAPPPLVLDPKERARRAVKEAQGRYAADNAQGTDANAGADKSTPATPPPTPRPYREVMAEFARDEAAAGFTVTWPYGDASTARMEITGRAFLENLPALRARAQADGRAVDAESNVADAELAKDMALAFMSKRLDSGFKAAAAANCRLVLHNQGTGATVSASPDFSRDPEMAADFNNLTRTGQ